MGCSTTLSAKRSFGLLAAGWLTVVALFTPAFAQTADDDFAFASGLVEWGFSDFAIKYGESLAVADPSVADRVNLIKVQALIAARKFADAEGVLATLPAGSKAEAARLALANAYNAYGNTDKAIQYYKEFFSRAKDKPTDPDVLRFYRDAAYRYAIILEQAADYAGAAAAYDRVLQTAPEKDIQRRILNDKSQVMYKQARDNKDGKRDQHIANCRKVIEEIQWGGVDIWFGQSIITLANLELITNDAEKALETIEDYRDIFDEIDSLLVENEVSLGVSPMAGARFLSGQISEKSAEEAEAAGDQSAALKYYAAALNEYYNVFVKYGESEVGPEAGVRAQTIKDTLESKYGKKVSIDLGARADEAAATQVRMAETLYREGKYAEAANSYLKIANAFPESATTVNAMLNLMMCYARQGDDLMVDTLASYIGERFQDKPAAANALLATAKYYLDEDKGARSTRLYETYLEGYPRHEKAGTILFFLASLRKKVGDEASAADFYRRIIEEYPTDRYYTKALSQVAWSFHQAGNYAEAAEYFRKQVAESAIGPEKAQAQFSLADALLRLERFTEAASEFNTLKKWLEAPGNAYGSSPSEQAKNKEILEMTIFQLAFAMSRINEPAERVSAFREAAIQQYDQFVAAYPRSKYAPMALNGKGSLLLELKRFDDAASAFDTLAAEYPDSEEGKNGLYSLARAAMEIGQNDQGVAAFERMMKETDRYGADEFIRLGLMMGDAGFAKEAIRAFQEVQLKVSRLPADQQEGSRVLLERSLYGSAQAFRKSGQNKEAIEAANELLTRFPKSGLFYDAKFLQGEAYRDNGQFHEAVEALSDVFRYASNPELINQATLTLAEVQRSNGELVEALASYQRLALLTDRTKADLRPMIEDSLVKSIEIAKGLDRWQVVLDSADEYIDLFPKGEQLEAVRKARSEAVLKLAATQ